MRFIPTHVGNTILLHLFYINPTVHPHACGEHSNCTVVYRAFSGSSPRMWGTLVNDLTGGVGPRFIPTHVGNTVG